MYRDISTTNITSIRSSDTTYQELNDIESQIRVPKKNLVNDEFLRACYVYYRYHGFAHILLSKLSQIITFLAILLIIFFFTSCVNYSVVLREDIQGEINNNLSRSSTIRIEEIITLSQIINTPKIRFLFLIIEVPLLLYILLQIVSLIRDLPRLFYIRSFLATKNILRLRFYTWRELLEKTVNITTREERIKIAAILLQKENYITAILNNYKINPRYYTPIIDFFLSNIIYRDIFSDSGLREIKNTTTNIISKKYLIRYYCCGIFSILLLIPLLIYSLFYYIVQYLDILRTQPSLLMQRSWTLYAQYRYRYFSEYPHLVEERLSVLRPTLDQLFEYFGYSVIDWLREFMRLIVASFLFIILIFGLLQDNNWYRVEFLHRSLFYYGGLLTIILSLLRSIRTNNSLNIEQIITNLENNFSLELKNAEEIENFYYEVSANYQYVWQIYFNNIFSVIYLPYIFIYYLPKHNEEYINYIRDITDKSYQCCYGIFEETKTEYTTNHQLKMEQSSIYFE